MMAMDLSRFAAMSSIPLAYALGGLTFGQLLAVSVISGAADITFKAASGASLKAVVRPATCSPRTRGWSPPPGAAPCSGHRWAGRPSDCSAR